MLQDLSVSFGGKLHDTNFTTMTFHNLFNRQPRYCSEVNPYIKMERRYRNSEIKVEFITELLTMYPGTAAVSD